MFLRRLNSNGPKRYAQLWTGDKEIEVPGGVDSVMFQGSRLITAARRQEYNASITNIAGGG